MSQLHNVSIKGQGRGGKSNWEIVWKYAIFFFGRRPLALGHVLMWSLWSSLLKESFKKYWPPWFPPPNLLPVVQLKSQGGGWVGGGAGAGEHLLSLILFKQFKVWRLPFNWLLHFLQKIIGGYMGVFQLVSWYPPITPPPPGLLHTCFYCFFYRFP